MKIKCGVTLFSGTKVATAASGIDFAMDANLAILNPV